MRMIGSIPSFEDAERFGDYLLAQGVVTNVEESSAGDAQVWVESDDHLDRAKSELHAFLANPADPKYGRAGADAERVRKEQAKKQERLNKQYVNVRTRWSSAAGWAAPVTIGLMILSVVLSIGTKSVVPQHMNQSLADKFRFVSWDDQRIDPWLDARPEIEDAGRVEFLARYWLYTLSRGEVWRLVTPIFIHFGILHLLFNLFWLRDLGGMVETRMGTWRAAVLVFIVAVVSNFAQYLWNGPGFGGMSGVNYGLFAYIWIKQRYEPYLGLGISQQAALILMAWLILSMTGIVGDIANAAHVVGLLVGAVYAYAPVGWRQVGRLARNRGLSSRR
jgi:GlpG protein